MIAFYILIKENSALFSFLINIIFLARSFNDKQIYIFLLFDIVTYAVVRTSTSSICFNYASIFALHTNKLLNFSVVCCSLYTLQF